jgi:excisionase family DNA binding protein
MTIPDYANGSVAEPLRSVREAATYLGVSDSTIRRMVRSGVLPDRRVGAQLRFARDDLDAAINRTTSTERAEEAPFPVPPWAVDRVARWKAEISSVIPAGHGAQAIVIDRRGSKAFEVLRPSGFVWGRNLWHSDGLEVLSDDELHAMFIGSDVFLFDELVQRGRDLFRIKQRLANLGIVSRSICLVRRRSGFLEGELQDLDVEAIDDLSDDDFREAAAFLSRLFDYSEPPLDPEHVLVSGTSTVSSLADMACDRIEEFGIVGEVWNKSSRHDAAIAALTIDRPYFFDVSRCSLPGGITAEWNGPCKARPYVSYSGGRVACAFITYPTLHGSDEAWRNAVAETNSRYGSKRTNAELLLDDPYLVRAYIDICTDLSVELLRQSVASGLFAALGITKPEPPLVANLSAFFGSKRAAELDRQIRTALDQTVELPIPAVVAVPVAVDAERSAGIVTEPVRARRAILTNLPHRAPGESKHECGISYSELLIATRPIAESTISVALDGLIDGVDVKPAERIVRDSSGSIQISRVFMGSEYGDELLDVSAVHTYDVRQTKRTVAVSVAALDQWLGHRGQTDETEITVAKLLVNLAHDWAPQTPLAIRPYPYKHGFMPALNTDVPYVRNDRRYLIRELTEAGLLRETRNGRHTRYRVASDVRPDKLLATAALTGQERASLRGLVRTYAAIQEHIKVIRPSSHRTNAGRVAYSDPLILLSSARNEKVIFATALFEVGDWVRLGRQIFRLLGSLDGMPIDSGFIGSVHRTLQEFAQASAFLFNKLAMYEALPKFRTDLVALVDELGLDHGEIILDTVDEEPRFSMDYSTSSSPVGLLRRAWTIMQPFSSFLRQLLTELGIEADTRSELVKKSEGPDGEETVKDIHHYASEMSGALRMWDIPFKLQRVPEAVGNAVNSKSLDVAILSDVDELFEAIVTAIRSTVRDEDGAAEARATSDRRRTDLTRIAREIELIPQVTRGSCIAVGDFYNFVGMVRQLAVLSGSSEAAMGERVQGWMEEKIKSLQTSHPLAIWRVASDNVVIAAPTSDDAIGAALALNEQLRQTLTSWDRDEATHVGWMRFGVSRIEDEVHHAVIEAYRLSDGLRLPRGTFVMTKDVHSNMSLLKERFDEQKLDSGETVWLFNP